MQHMLLYIENKLLPEQMESYSIYLRENPQEMRRVLQITQALALYHVQNAPLHRIEILDKAASALDFILEGVVSLLDRQELAFRGVPRVMLYRFSFLDLAFELIESDKGSLEFILSKGQEIEFIHLETSESQQLLRGDSVMICPDTTYLVRYAGEYLFISF